MTTTLASQSSSRERGNATSPHTAVLYADVAAHLGPRCTPKGVEMRVSRAVLLLDVLIERAGATGLTDQVDRIFASLNAKRQAHLAEANDNPLRRHAIACSTEQVTRCEWQEAQDAAARRREIEALVEEIAAAEGELLALEGAR